MTDIRCYSCREFFDKREPECPECGAKKRSANVALASAAWASNLNAQALHTETH